MASELVALAARVEAEEPSRELDTEIWLAVTPGSTRKQWSYVHKASGKTCEMDETRDGDRRLIVVPSYTSSLDAADSLRLPGQIPDMILFGSGCVTITLLESPDSHITGMAEVPSGPHAEARARLAAALRARDAGGT